MASASTTSLVRNPMKIQDQPDHKLIIVTNQELAGYHTTKIREPVRGPVRVLVWLEGGRGSGGGGEFVGHF